MTESQSASRSNNRDDSIAEASARAPLSVSRRLRHAIFFVVMLLFTVTLCFAVLELTVSTYYSGGQSAPLSRFHPVRGWSLVPGDYTLKPQHGFANFTIRIDQYGLRAHNPPTAEANRRILVLGDSFTFATETRTERMFTQRLEQLLNKGGAPGVQVMNAGVPGYGTAQELLFMRELRKERGVYPETYLLMFFTNDILDNLCLSYGTMAAQPARPCFHLAADGNPVLAKAPEPLIDIDDDTLVQRSAGPSSRTLAVGKALTEEWLQTKPGLVRLLGRFGVDAKIGRMPGLLNGWYRDRIVTDGTALTAALIRQMRLEAGDAGARLIVSMVPSPFQVYPATYLPLLRKGFPDSRLVDDFIADPARPQRLLRQICVDAGLPFQDLLPVFREHADRALFLPRDGHLNDAGHELVATSLFEFLAAAAPPDH